MFDVGDKFDLSQRIPWMTDAKVKQPSRMTALWTHTVLNQPGRRSVRGFGGRIMFHGRETEKPVRVEGTLTIYAFDETERASSVPERKFVFTADQFETHYSKSKLGHSYSIWLPWDEVGGDTRRINLVARFEPTGGALIMSEPSVQVLPGIPADDYDSDRDSRPKKLDPAIQQAGYEAPSKLSNRKQTPFPRDSVESETINLPASFNRRLSNQNDSLLSQPTMQESPQQISPAEIPDVRKIRELRNEPNGTDSKENTDSTQETTTNSPLKMMMERRKELSNHFERRKSQVQRASTAQSTLSPAQNEQTPPSEQFGRLRKSSTEEKDPFETDPIPASSSSR